MAIGHPGAPSGASTSSTSSTATTHVASKPKSDGGHGLRTFFIIMAVLAGLAAAVYFWGGPVTARFWGTYNYALSVKPKLVCDDQATAQCSKLYNQLTTQTGEEAVVVQGMPGWAANALCEHHARITWSDSQGVLKEAGKTNACAQPRAHLVQIGLQPAHAGHLTISWKVTMPNGIVIYHIHIHFYIHISR